MAELIGGAVLGAVVGELLKAVLLAKEKVSKFNDILTSIESTLKSIIPRLDEIILLNNKLNTKQHEMAGLVDLVEEGKELVLKCSKISKFSLWKGHYYKRLVQLQNNLQRYFMTILPLDHFRDNKEMLVMIKEMHSKFVCYEDGCDDDEPEELDEMFCAFKNQDLDSKEDSEEEDKDEDEEEEEEESHDPEEEEPWESDFVEEEYEKLSRDFNPKNVMKSYKNSKKEKDVKQGYSKKYSENEGSEEEEEETSDQGSRKKIPLKWYSKKYSDDEESVESYRDSDEEEEAANRDPRKEIIVKWYSKKYSDDDKESAESYQDFEEEESLESYNSDEEVQAATLRRNPRKGKVAK